MTDSERGWLMVFIVTVGLGIAWLLRGRWS
jgi:hypothetical protein